jgi:hypothetical protein
VQVFKRVSFAMACAVLAIVPAAAYAQASITGVVKDPSGGVLPGVTVEASSPVLIEKVRAAVTDGSGVYRIVDLRPGTYAVTFSLPGFTTVRREGIVLTGSFSANVNADLKVGALEETITVSGATPVVDLHNASRESTIDAEVIKSLPATRGYGALLNATPGLEVNSGGLATTPTMTFFAAHGGPINEGRVAINGMVVAASFNGGGVSSLVYDTNNADEVTTLVSGGLGESETGGPTINIVPRSGGNTFSGEAFLNTAGRWSSGNNVDDQLRDIGISEGLGVIRAYDGSVSLGGPIKRDRIWFYGTYRQYESSAPAAAGNVHLNLNAGDPARFDYAPDLGNNLELRSIQGRKIWSARGTAQITARNRVSFSQEQQYRCEGSTLTLQGNGCRKRGSDWIALGSTTQSPEANTGYYDLPYWVTQATWTSPVTSRLLLEAGVTRFAYDTNGGPGIVAPDGIFDLIPVTEQVARDGHNANFSYRAVNTYRDQYASPRNWRFTTSYVTGSHNVKIGYQGGYSISNTITRTNSTLLAYRFRNGVPNQFTWRLPNFQQSDRTATTALFVQDGWTHGRLSLQGAVRWDRASSFSPAEGNGTTETSPFNSAAISFDRSTSVSGYNDISPRVGVAYDVFGNGRTALKFNLGRYLDAATNDGPYVQNNPAARTVSSASRSWEDGNGNFVVDCDILNPARQATPGGDTCGAAVGDALNFGQAGAGTQVNPDTLHGWGVRGYDWQWGLNLQQELLPRMSVEVGYNRRWFGNFTVTDNLSVGPSDYEKWTITAPSDPRLPDGGGYPIDVYTLTAAAAARPARNLVTFETDYGDARSNYWHGVDVTLKARTKQGLNLQAGTSTGRSITDTCATEVLIDSPDPRNCHSVEPFRTTLRGLASYTVPLVDVLVSATLRSEPPLQLGGLFTTTGNGARLLVPNTVVRDQLGRLPPGGLATGTTTVYLIDNGAHRLYADNRRTQVDMRFAKVLRFGTRRADIGVDLYNLLNTNYATGYESLYSLTAANGGTWHNPTAILPPRFVRLNFTLDF